MLDGGEGGQAVADDIVLNVHGLGGEGGGHGVVDVVLAAEREVLQEDLRLLVLVADDDAVVAEEGTLRDFFLLGERQHLGLDDDLAQLGDGDGVVGVENEAVLGTEVARDAEFRAGVVLDLVVVAVEVVRRDVGDDSDVGPEIIGVVQLETADFQYVIVVLLGRDLQRVALADVAAQAGVQAGFPEQVIDQGRGRGLAVGPRDADLLRAVVARGEFDFRYDVRALLAEGLHHGGRAGDARTLDDLVRIQDAFRGVPALLEGDVPLLQGLEVLVLDLPVVGQEDVESFYFRQHGGAHAALCSSQYYNSCHSVI